MCSQIRYLIRLITKKSDDYDEKYIKINCNLVDEFPLNKTIEFPSMTVAVRECLYKL